MDLMISKFYVQSGKNASSIFSGQKMNTSFLKTSFIYIAIADLLDDWK